MIEHFFLCLSISNAHDWWWPFYIRSYSAIANLKRTNHLMFALVSLLSFSKIRKEIRFILRCSFQYRKKFFWDLFNIECLQQKFTWIKLWNLNLSQNCEYRFEKVLILNNKAPLWTMKCRQHCSSKQHASRFKFHCKYSTITPSERFSLDLIKTFWSRVFGFLSQSIYHALREPFFLFSH